MLHDRKIGNFTCEYCGFSGALTTQIIHEHENCQMFAEQRKQIADAPPKQVIVIRKMGMRRGKECAQAAHASIKWLVDRMKPLTDLEGSLGVGEFDNSLREDYLVCRFSTAELSWLRGTFSKITCQVNSEEELQAIYDKAKEAGLVVSMIIDNGNTEFHGVPTKTAVAIGPDWADKIDPITKELKLY